MLSFASLGVSPEMCRVLAERGIEEPFPIQAATLPDALAGHDVSGRAPTGSGKTLAYGLAIATRVERAAPRRPRALVLVPTRELALQVQRELAGIVPASIGKVAAIYGGTGYGPQLEAVRRAAVIVACPGRLEDLVARRDVSLDDVDIAVIDEADRMADMGFLPAVKRILDLVRPDRQTLLFSATLDGDVDVLVKRYQRNTRKHEVGAAPNEGPGENVEHHFWRTDAARRIDLTAELARTHGSMIVFCRTCHGADRVTRRLEQMGVYAATVHGRRTQSQREKALSSFTRGVVNVMVATDVAARGIHVDDVECVVHFDLPDDPKDYIHRSGRTGRAGASGIVIGFVAAPRDKLGDQLAQLMGVRITDAPAPGAGGPGMTANPDAPKRTLIPALTRSSSSSSPSSDHGRPPRDHHRDRSVGGPARDAGNRSPARSFRRDDSFSSSSSSSSADAGVGVVASFNPAKGFGFISQGSGPDLYVRAQSVRGQRDALRPGQRVQFDIGPGRKGLEAQNVRLHTR
jgi:superfamily II DNA/RNA helicase